MNHKSLTAIPLVLLFLAVSFVVVIRVLAQEQDPASEDINVLADTDIVINEVFYLGNSSSEDWIELKNVGSTTVNIGSWFLCARLNCNNSQPLTQLTLLDGGDLTLDPGEIVRLQSWTNLNNSSSDLGLYISTNFGNPNDMVDYVQWGASLVSPSRVGVAVAKGIWTETSSGRYDFVPAGEAGQALVYHEVNSGGGLLTQSSDFTNCAPTPGIENICLKVGKQANTSTINPGGTISYTLTVTSSGALSNTNVVLTDTLPVSTSFVSAEVVPIAGRLTWLLGNMLPPQTVLSRTFVVTANAPAGTTIINANYGVQSDQLNAAGSAVVVQIPAASGDTFIYLPVIFKDFVGDTVDEHAADLE